MTSEHFHAFGRHTGKIDDSEFTRIIDNIRQRFPMSEVARRAGVNLKRSDNEWKGRCPFHDDSTPSFYLYANDTRGHCFGCGWTGDVLDFVQKAYRVRWREAVEMLDGGVLREVEQQRTPAQPRSKSDMQAVVQRIVDASVPVDGTPAEAYLRSRGITMPLPHTLRFARIAAPKKPDDNGVRQANGAASLPALIAIVTDHAGALVGIQRTYLTEGGQKAASIDGKVKYSLGSIRGGAIQLGPPAASIIVTEGLEDGLTLAQALGRSVWVAAGTSMMPQMMFGATTRAVVIGADGDAAGEAAANKAAAAFTARGLATRIMRPSIRYKDFNAELMGAQS